ncbi:membrane protein insertion efficiency factor YidD [Loigolactobacillus bifermentans]|uniref:Putative membrane protein insertion efficiency factor n=1 Tax=Loigolactobacillus bifermentans DSM 20003 TaxID=1423726 RepID=A0A0R1GXE0_9LACO|nr:membrane protein insertion efficiency factor YidD [Loigolactobacillus bifermentans]KRK39019.1 hypothetical protein FC07_GL002739 [Loigolactobacillus bifermentans DSM 20003]QGG59092.1 membrane protein insertion efficiency factor YidD [Loigolactobacillus bifermentans]
MQTLLLGLIRLYQHGISPWLPKSCRYYPTCSHYTDEAIQRFGWVKGSLMGLSRILRCQPFSRGGFDPVPSRFQLKRNGDPQQIEIAKGKYYGETTN